jgi:YidC/Oxa1 family membrane protein insertase
MDKLKVLNIFAIAFLVSLLLQYWFFPKPNTSVTPTDIFLSIEADSIVVPNIPKITLHNTTKDTITVNPCNDITLTIDSRPLSGVQEIAPDFCKSVTVNTNGTSVIPFDPLYKIFSSQPWKYLITLKSWVGERNVWFSLSVPGWLRSMLTTLVYEPIYNLFVALLTWMPWHSLGWAIVIITLIIRLILLVPQQHMLESQKKLQKIQPKIKAIQEEYKEDKALLGQKIMELYKKEGVNPMGSCLPLLIQMPILIGLYWVISWITDPSNFYHLYPIFKDFNPTSIITDFFGINLSQVGGIMAVVFGIILGITQWVQAYISIQHTKKSKDSSKEITTPKDPNSLEAALDPELMQKMMLYMLPLMLAVSAYFFPLGVGLYWFIGTLFVIAQQWYVNNKKDQK